MRIRYRDRAVTFMRRMREQDKVEYDSLRGLIILLSTDPPVDNETKFLRNSGDGDLVPVYTDEDWIIYYRVDSDSETGEETLVIVSIWDAARPPHTRL